MKKGGFSLLGIVALFLSLILVSCSDDDDQGGVIDTGIHKIVVEQSGDIDAFEKLKVLVTAYIDGKEVNQLVKEYETKGEILIENFSVSTTAK